MDRQIDSWMEGRTDGQTDRQADRHIGRQTDRQIVQIYMAPLRPRAQRRRPLILSLQAALNKKVFSPVLKAVCDGVFLSSIVNVFQTVGAAKINALRERSKQRDLGQQVAPNQPIVLCVETFCSATFMINAVVDLSLALVMLLSQFCILFVVRLAASVRTLKIARPTSV